MPHAPSRPAGVPKQLVQVRLSDDEIQLVDAFADALSRQSYGAQFSRPEVLKLAALAWLRTRQAEALSPAAMPDPQPLSPARREEDAPVILAPFTGATRSQAIPAKEATPHTKPLSPWQHAVVQYLVARGNAPVTLKELATGLGLKQQAVAATVRFMRQDQILTVTADGRYTLTGAYSQG